MADITVRLPKADATDSINVAQFAATTLGATNKVLKAFENKNNSMVLIFNITTAGTMKIKKGNNYPNAVLGDLDVTLPTGITAIQIKDAARFENRDGSIDFTITTAAGTVVAVAKREGVLPKEDQ